MKRLLYIALLLHQVPALCQLTSYRMNKTPEYEEVIGTYRMLDNKYEEASLLEYGTSDEGKKMHLFVISPQKLFTAEEARKKNSCVLFINNGIHPGEPDGVNASIEFAADILSGRIKMPPGLVIAIVPIYNIEGALNRGCCSRANQEGPDEYGFRGNALNLDLNRDFIKMDSENTRAFVKMFRSWDPDLFVDTHVSDGADYQYAMTLIASQKDKLNRILSSYLQSTLLPQLYQSMETAGYPMCPYVNVWKGTPDKGYEGFLETPRFATGYAALFNSFGFVTETHMLKPFPQRVEATYSFLFAIMNIAGKEHVKIKELRNLARQDCIMQQKFALQWKVDSTSWDTILFKGYEGIYKNSPVTGHDRLYYDRSRPYEKYIRYYNDFKPAVEVEKPKAYIIPQAWKEVIERLQENKVRLETILKDTVLQVSSYYINNYQSSPAPYEGHHLKTVTELEKKTQMIQFYKGDYVAECNQESNRFIIETLEPQGVDSWFTWGFFDAVLQQKEWFSDYIFIDEAQRMLEKDAALKGEFEKKKKTDAAFAKDDWAMLTWLYHRSKFYEASHNRLPVFRVE